MGMGVFYAAGRATRDRPVAAMMGWARPVTWLALRRAGSRSASCCRPRAGVPVVVPPVLDELVEVTPISVASCAAAASVTRDQGFAGVYRRSYPLWLTVSTSQTLSPSRMQRSPSHVGIGAPGLSFRLMPGLHDRAVRSRAGGSRALRHGR